MPSAVHDRLLAPASHRDALLEERESLTACMVCGFPRHGGGANARRLRPPAHRRDQHVRDSSRA